jgi:hypothetical protein
MTRNEILLKMAADIPRRLFPTMQLGGNARRLMKMEDDGLISSQARYRGAYRQRNWYLSDRQYAKLWLGNEDY